MAQEANRMDEAFERRKSIIGIRMTILYSLVYAGFVMLSVFRPAWMGVKAVLGLNLAVAYGLGLILIAILFAVIYNRLCRLPPSAAPQAADAPAQSPSVSGQRAGQWEE